MLLSAAPPSTCVSLLPQALYNEYVHFKETEIPAKEMEKGQVEHLYKLLEVRREQREEGGEEYRGVVGKRSRECAVKVADVGHHVQSSLCVMGFSSWGFLCGSQRKKEGQ